MTHNCVKSSNAFPGMEKAKNISTKSKNAKRKILKLQEF